METNWTSYEDYLTKIKKKYIKGLSDIIPVTCVE